MEIPGELQHIKQLVAHLFPPLKETAEHQLDAVLPFISHYNCAMNSFQIKI